MIDKKDINSIINQILNGMKSLHEKNIIHRDLKLANVLMHDGIVKVAIF